MPLTLERAELLRTQHFISGTWQSKETTFRIDNPATGDIIATLPDGGALEAEEAADAAYKAFPKWKATPPKRRAQALKAWHGLVIDNREDLARLLSAEQGKPLAESRGEILYAASYIEWFAEQALRANGEIIPSHSESSRMLAVKEPVGVVAIVTPWNFPAAMIARKIAPALAAGCTVVCKPSEDAPLSSLALAFLAQEAGLPSGVLNIVTASRESTPETVDAWLDDDRVRKVSFTGSTQVGKHLARRSSDTLKKLSLELGGNAPFVVFEDASLEVAVDSLMAAKFRNGGQTCVSPNRILVHQKIASQFSQMVAERVRALKVGPATDDSSEIGPMINVRAVEKIHSHVTDAVSKGARVLVGGEKLTALGANFYAPTVICDATPQMIMSCEETFGPVAAISNFENEAEAIARANDTPYGLAAYFFTNDYRRIWRVSEALEAGMVAVNEGVLSNAAAPFGGVKHSGYGREGSVHGLDDYTHIKYVCVGDLDSGNEEQIL